MQDIFIVPAMHATWLPDQRVTIERLHRSLLQLLLSTKHEVANFTLEIIMTDELLLNKLIEDKLSY